MVVGDLPPQILSRYYHWRRGQAGRALPDGIYAVPYLLGVIGTAGAVGSTGPNTVVPNGNNCAISASVVFPLDDLTSYNG